MYNTYNDACYTVFIKKKKMFSQTWLKAKKERMALDARHTKEVQLIGLESNQFGCEDKGKWKGRDRRAQ